MSEKLKPEMGQLPAGLDGSLAEPHQVLILCALGNGPQSVAQLAGALDVSVRDIRQHLQVLCQNRLVIGDYSWPTAEYRLVDSRLSVPTGFGKWANPY